MVRRWTCPCGKTLMGAGIAPHQVSCSAFKAGAQGPMASRVVRSLRLAAEQMRKVALAFEREAISIEERMDLTKARGKMRALTREQPEPGREATIESCRDSRSGVGVRPAVDRTS